MVMGSRIHGSTGAPLPALTLVRGCSLGPSAATAAALAACAGPGFSRGVSGWLWPFALGGTTSAGCSFAACSRLLFLAGLGAVAVSPRSAGARAPPAVDCCKFAPAPARSLACFNASYAGGRSRPRFFLAMLSLVKLPFKLRFEANGRKPYVTPAGRFGLCFKMLHPSIPLGDPNDLGS